MTELYINDKLIDSIETEIALTVSSFKLDSLGTRKGSYSNVFDLPKTNVNKLLFENCDIVTSVTSIPYQLNTCQIYVDGQLIVNGSAIIRETKENYKVFISAGNSDFFKSIASLKIKDVNLSEFDHINNFTNIRTRRETTEGFVYPNIDYGFWEFADLNTWNTGTVANRHQYFQPSMYVKSIIENAGIDLGYTIKGDLLDSITYQKSVLLCKGSVIDITTSLAKYRHNIDYNQLTDLGTQKINFPERIEDKELLYKNDVTINHFVYTPNISSISDIRFDINVTGKVTTNTPRPFSNGIVFVDMLIYNASGTLLLTLTSSVQFPVLFTGLFNRYNPPPNGQMSLDINFTYPGTRNQAAAFASLINSVGDLTTLRFGWQVRTNKNVTGAGLPKLKFENLEFSINQIPQIGRSMSPEFILIEANRVLPQTETVGDLLITLANIEGIIFQVDETTKTVTTSKIDNLIDRKGNALDWSNKLDLTEEIETIYTIDNFAQRNLYKFANDDKDQNIIEGLGEGSINVNNVNIATEKIVFESKFSTVPVFPTFNGELLFGKVFTGNKYNYDGFNYNLIEPLKIEDFKSRLAVLSEIESVLDISLSSPTDINFNVNPLVLDFERSINDNYKLLRSVLTNTKVIKALFLLNLEDIINIDFTIPIYIEFFGEFFYIETIEQFKINKRESCFITLVRI